MPVRCGTRAIFRATDDQGRQLNIEIQTSLPAGLRQRLTFYASRLFVEQIQDGEKYQKLRPAIVICVLTTPLFWEPNALHFDFRLRDRQGTLFSDDIQVHTLELTKLTATREKLVQASAAERWAHFLRHAESMSGGEIQAVFTEPEFVEAAGVLEMINQTPEQLEQYRARMKFRMDEIARLDYAREEGEKKGRQEGLQKGRQEGRREGLQKGELIGQIATLQSILGTSIPTREELLTLDLTQLTELAMQLQQQLRNRDL